MNDSSFPNKLTEETTMTGTPLEKVETGSTPVVPSVETGVAPAVVEENESSSSSLLMEPVEKEGWDDSFDGHDQTGPPTPEWPECNPLYMEKRLVAKLIGDLDHCMIFRKGTSGNTACS
jgi:hypothetical protein